MPQWSNSIDHFWYDFQFFRTITFVIYVGLRFNNMSPNKTGIHYQVKAYKHKLFLLFSCGLIFAPSTSLLPLLLLHIPRCFVCFNAHTDTRTHSFDGRNHRPQKFESLLQSMSYYRSVSKFYDHQKSIKYIVACVKLYLNDVWWINVLFF